MNRIFTEGLSSLKNRQTEYSAIPNLQEKFLGLEPYQQTLESIYQGLGIPVMNQLELFEQGWPGNDTVCGWGSTMEHTKNVRHILPKLIKDYNIRSINDAGCGDLFWIKTIIDSSFDYHGYDLYSRSTWVELREEGWKLGIADITKDTLRSSDLTIVRDVFIHLPNDLVLDALDKLSLTSKYLLATNFIRNESEDILVDNFARINGTSLKHSKINLSDAPFSLGTPELIIPEDYPFKNMSLWKLQR